MLSSAMKVTKIRSCKCCNVKVIAREDRWFRGKTTFVTLP